MTARFAVAALAVAAVLAGALVPAAGAEDRAGAAAGFTVLATGDSMMQVVDVHLARRLAPGGRADMHSDMARRGASSCGEGCTAPASATSACCAAA